VIVQCAPIENTVCLIHCKQVSNEFITRERPDKVIRGADSEPATNVSQTYKS